MNILHVILFLSTIVCSCTKHNQTTSNRVQLQTSTSEFSEDNLSDIIRFLGKKTFQRVHIEHVPQNIFMIHDVDSLLSLYEHVQNKKQKVSILRQSLIAVNMKHARTLDSLRFLNDDALLMFLSTAFHVDIEQDPLEFPKNELNDIMKSLDSLLNIQSSHATIIRYINNQVFRYQWMHYRFAPIDDQLLKFEYNAGGMAGSSLTHLYLKRNGKYEVINIDKLFTIIDNKISKVVKEDAWTDYNRFEMEISPTGNPSGYAIECYVQVYSGALCCPQYITRFITQDFSTYLPGTFYYTTSDHKSDQQFAPYWNNIE